MKLFLRDVLRKYRWQFGGMVAFAIQRVTGILLLFYLFLHVHTVSKLSQGPAAFDRAIAAFNGPFFKLLEIALLATVVLHAMNGIRITLMDWGIGVGRQRQMFWLITIAAGTLVTLAGAVPMFLFAVLRVR